ncbi:MAG: J domain-containing protein [Clostridia bacterium]|nr:J domain-containing protein [Clostridia bacterium]
MNKKNLELLGLEEGATLEEIKAAYEALREKYLEDRFKDGEVGNNAAKMLTKIDVAYSELESEFKEKGTEDGDLFERAEQYLKDGNYTDAQRILDSFNERGARWHYLQSVIFYRKNWINESKKQLEIAIQLEPENAKYKEAYRKLNEKINVDAQATAGGSQQGAYQGQTMDSTDADSQMGGNFCANCIECCYINMCINCLCGTCCR